MTDVDRAREYFRLVSEVGHEGFLARIAIAELAPLRVALERVGAPQLMRLLDEAVLIDLDSRDAAGRATRQYLEILKLFGKFTAVSIGEVESNLKKVERAAGGRFRTMKALLRDEVERRAGSAGGATEAEEDELNAAMELTGSLLVRAVAAATPGAPIPSQSADVMRAAVDAAKLTARDICDALTESTNGHKGAGGGGRGGGGRGGGRGRGRGRRRGMRTSDAAQLGAHSERLSKRASIEPSLGLP